MEHGASLKRVARLKKTIDKILERTKKPNNVNWYTSNNNNQYLDNTNVVLKNMSEDLDKFGAHIKGERKPTVGVFGCPSRGKSTLLNVLLGVNMLPMKGKAGTTRFGIELSHKDAKGFYITIKYNSKPPEIRPKNYQDPFTEDEAADELKLLSGQSDLVNPDITKIEVQGPFHSYLGKDIVFIDTPGVELGASADDLPDDSPLKQDFAADTRRALAVLSSVDVVIFCMINKYKEKKDAVFYNQVLQDRYDPINIITAGDKRDDDQTNEDIKLLVQNDYHLIKGHTVVVSSKEALEKIKEAKAGGKDITKLVENEFTGENLEDFRKLKQMILKRVMTTDEDIKARLTRFEELYEIIKKDALEKGIDLENDSSPSPAGPVPASKDVDGRRDTQNEHMKTKKKPNKMALIILGLIFLFLCFFVF